MEAFTRASDDDDAVDVGVLGQFLGEFGEAFDWPTLGGPCGGGGEDGVGLGVLDHDLRELFLSGVVGDIRIGDVSARGLREGEHTVHGVHGFGSVDAFVVEEPTEFLGVLESISQLRSGGSGEESGAGESLAIEDHVVVVFAEFAEPSVERCESELPALLTQFRSCKWDDLVEVGVVLDCLGEGVSDHPVDFGIRVFLLERGENGGSTADVSERAWADNEDALWV